MEVSCLVFLVLWIKLRSQTLREVLPDMLYPHPLFLKKGY